MSVFLGATHVLCAVGSGTEQVWASVRCGIGRIASSPITDRYFEPIQMGLVPEASLGELPATMDSQSLPIRVRRILRLAAPSFMSVARELTGPVPLFVGLPEPGAEGKPWLHHVPSYLERITGVAVDRERSRAVPQGRAAALLALEHAVKLLESGQATTAVVGGVDSFLDPELLARLEAEDRILTQRVMDGFVPGEGAAFYVLSSEAGADVPAVGPRIVINGVASSIDQGHRYGSEPARGEGLALALAELRKRVTGIPPIATTFAGFNGENFEGKLWGVACLRHSDFFSATMPVEHPADKFGDTGAAIGAILIALAGRSLATGARRGPALVWAASDREARSCAVLSVV